MAKGYSARNGFGGSAGMMRQQQQMQQKLARMQQDMEAAQKNVEESSFTASSKRPCAAYALEMCMRIIVYRFGLLGFCFRCGSYSLRKPSTSS